MSTIIAPPAQTNSRVVSSNTADSRSKPVVVAIDNPARNIAATATQQDRQLTLDVKVAPQISLSALGQIANNQLQTDTAKSVQKSAKSYKTR
jgi:hypothetical protein